MAKRAKKRGAIPMTIIDAINDAELFKPWFKDPETWIAWLAFLRCLFGLPMSESDCEIFRQCTGRTAPLGKGHLVAHLVCGRRSGKSLVLALIAVFLAVCRDWRPYLSPGERGTVCIISADRKQSRVIFRYLLAFLKNVPSLAGLIERETADLLELQNGVSIEIQTASFRTTRGYTLIAALCDEIAYWLVDGASPDREIINALRPAMATIPGAMLLCASSPYAKRGVLWSEYEKHFGKDDDPVLVWQAETVRMNPTVPSGIIAEAYADDPANAAAEYGAQFRSDVSGYVTVEALDQCIVKGRYEIPPSAASGPLVCFIDPSGGSGKESMTMAIAGRNELDDKIVLHCVREVKGPHSPDATVSEFAAVMKSYGLRQAYADRYAADWPVERFAAHGITLRPSPKNKSQLFLELVPLLNSARCELLDVERLRVQLIGLERRVLQSGAEAIGHRPGAFDDVANAAAGAIVLRAQNVRRRVTWHMVGVPMFGDRPDLPIRTIG
jgi:hypothetical protein